MPRRIVLLSIFVLCCVRLMSLDLGRARNCALTGTVLGDDGEPVQGHITAYHLGVRQGRIVPDVACATGVDTEGNFQCQHLESGAYLLAIDTLKRLAHASLEQSTSASPSDLPLFLFYPANPDLGPASLLHLAAGEVQSVDIQVSPDSLSTIQVKSATESASNKLLHIFLQAEDFTVPVNARIAMNLSGGNYTLKRVPSGTYRFAENWSVKGISREAIGSMTVGESSPNEVSLAEVTSHKVSGSVQYADQAAPRTPEVVLESAEREPSRRYIAAVMKDGSFTFRDIASGVYSVSFKIGDALFISNLVAGDQSLQDSTIVVDESISLRPLTLVAKSATATLSGSLELDGSEPKPGILVQSLDSHTSFIVSVDTRGSFMVRGLQPGRYLLYGWANIANVPYNSSHFLRRYADKAVELHLDNGSSLTGLEIECNNAQL